MSDATPLELVEEAKSPAKFNIIDVLNERAYPEDNVKVSLNEALAYKASMLKVRISETRDALPLKSDEAYEAGLAKIEKLTAEMNSIVAEIEKQQYTFTIRGISEGRRQEVLDIAMAKFPMEYEETTSPITGEVTKKEIESAERDNLFTNLLWREHIAKIESPDGDVQDNISIEDVVALRSSLPVAAGAKVNEAIEKVRVAAAMFMMTVDEDFLAKS